MVFTSKKEGDALKQEVRGLQGRMDTLDETFEQDRQQLLDMIERARAEMANLEETLKTATRVLARNSADFGAEMESLKERWREVDGLLAELQHSVDEVNKDLELSQKQVREFALAAGVDLPVDPSTVPAEAAAHWRAIDNSFAQSRFGECRSLAKLFLQRHAKNKRAPDVQLIIAKSHVEQNRYAKALGELRRFADKYPKNGLIPEVYYLTAKSFYMLGDCTDARLLIEAVTTRHKSSKFAAKAKTLLIQIKGPKSRCTSYIV